MNIKQKCSHLHDVFFGALPETRTGFFFNAASLFFFFYYFFIKHEVRIFTSGKAALSFSAAKERGFFRGEAVNERGNEPDL